ncbi:MAG: hypothetical protein ACREIF_03820 [Chthoniobacterales bacterium]
MFAKASRQVVALALCLSIGGHWFCLQSIAWANMIVVYSQHCSLPQAIAQTFDGQHPCDLCKHISKAREKEKKQDTQRSFAKTDLICTTRHMALLPPLVPFHYPGLNSTSRRAFQETPYPPPRLALI